MGWPIGVRKLCKNGKNWGNGHKWAKNNKKKMKKFSISYLKSMQLYFTHQLVPKSDEPRPWGGPWECTNVKNNNLKAGKMGFWWPHEAFLPWISVPRHTSIHKDKQHVAVVGLVLSRQLLEWKKRHSWNLRANKVQRSEPSFKLLFLTFVHSHGPPHGLGSSLLGTS